MSGEVFYWKRIIGTEEELTLEANRKVIEQLLLGEYRAAGLEQLVW